MFDTAIVRPQPVTAARRVTLVVSILIHSAVLIGVVSLSVASTRIPPDPPRQFELYRPADLPAAPPQPPGNPPQNSSRQAAPQKPEKPAPAPDPDRAPEMIPNDVPELPAQTSPITTTTGEPGSADGDGPIGSPTGTDPNAPYTGDVSGPGGSGQSTTIHQPGVGGVTKARILYKVEPRFPPGLVHGVRKATVVFRCIIDQDGQMRDPEIVSSTFRGFDEAVLAAVRQWKFAPGTMRGRPVDTWFELTVNFEVR